MALELPFYREILHDGLRIRKRATYSESAVQDEQNECLHHQIPLTNFMFDRWDFDDIASSTNQKL